MHADGGRTNVEPTAAPSPATPATGHPMRTRARDGIFQPNTRLVDYVMLDEEEIEDPMPCQEVGEEPSSFLEAEKEKGWRDATDKEMKSIVNNQTWELCKLPPGHQAIGLKWVYKLKKDAHAWTQCKSKGWILRRCSRQ